MTCPNCGAVNAEGARYCSNCGYPLRTAEAQASSSETSVGLAPNTAAVLSYVLAWLSGLVFVLVEKKNNYVRFHAWQSLITFGILAIAGAVLGRIPFIGWIFSSAIGVISFVLWVMLMIQASRGQVYKLPWVGDLAERQAFGIGS